jgi:3'(2'), 5'-bisphosphate nucleotidase
MVTRPFLATWFGDATSAAGTGSNSPQMPARGAREQNRPVPGTDSEASLDDHALAAALARRAGELLVELRGRGGLTGRALGDEGDQRSHVLLARGLAAARPHDAILSEEGRDDRARLDAPRVWIVDPLDGTREYGEPGRHDWAVHVALWADGELAAGAVALPALGSVLATPRVEAPPPWGAGGPPRIVVSRSRPPEVASELADRVGAQLVELGSAGAKAAAVVRGEADAYVHAGGQYEWDSAAPVAVARAAGLHASRLDGGPLVYNRPDPYLPDLLVCRAELASSLLEAITTSR